MTALLTRGSELLRAAGSITELAERLHVNRRTLSAWRSGSKLPNAGSRETMRRVLAIPVIAWEQRPGAAEAPSSPADAPAPPECSTSASGAPETAETRLRAQLERLRQQRQGATGRALLELEKLEARCTLQLARVEVVTIRSIVASGAWERMCDAMIVALEPWPDALAAVARAVDMYDAAERGRNPLLGARPTEAP